MNEELPQASNTLEVVTFGPEALPYFRAQLAAGDTFAHALLGVPLDQGSIISFLPSIANEQSRHAFDVSLFLTTGHRIGKQAINVKLADFIAAYLGQARRPYAIIETLARVSDPGLTRMALAYFTYATEVYVFHTKHDRTPESIRATLNSARDYPFICGLTTLPEDYPTIQSRRAVTLDTLEQLARNTRHILVGAYDAEGYLIWNRS